MTEKTMTVTEALSKIKRAKEDLNDYVRTGASNHLFYAYGIGKEMTTPSGVSKVDALRVIQSAHDRFSSTYNNLVTLKQAVAKSNYETAIDFNGATTTVASLIALKDQIVFKAAYLEMIIARYNEVTKKIEMTNVEVDRDLVRRTREVMNTNNTEEAQSHLATLFEAEREARKASIISIHSNPLEHITNLEKEVKDVRDKVDFLLSTSNSKTYITVDLV